MRRTAFLLSCLLLLVLLTSCAVPSHSKDFDSSAPAIGNPGPTTGKTIPTPVAVSEFVREHPDLGSIELVTEESCPGFLRNLTVTTDKGNYCFGLIDGVVCSVSDYYDKTSEIEEDDLKLGRLAFRDKGEKVVAVLGEPIEKSVKSERTTLGGREDEYLYWETWTYPHIEVTLMNFGTSAERPEDPGPVWAITARSAGYATTRGIEVGDPLQKVLRAYGTTNAVHEESGVAVFEFGEILCITIAIRNGAVESITARQLYD